MTYDKVKQRLQRAYSTISTGGGLSPLRYDPLAAFVTAIETFPARADDVPAYRKSLSRLAPEMRMVIEEALSWVTAPP